MDFIHDENGNLEFFVGNPAEALILVEKKVEEAEKIRTENEEQDPYRTEELTKMYEPLGVLK